MSDVPHVSTPGTFRHIATSRKESCGYATTEEEPTVAMKTGNPTMGVATGLARVAQDAPSSMMHGAAMAVLHITPLTYVGTPPHTRESCKRRKA